MTLRTLNDAPVVLGGIPVSSGPLASLAPPTVALSAFTRQFDDQQSVLIGDLILSSVDPAAALTRWWAVRIGGTVAAWGDLPADVGPFPLRLPSEMVGPTETLTVIVAHLDAAGVQGPVAAASIVVEPLVSIALVSGPTLTSATGGAPTAGQAMAVAVEITGDVTESRLLRFEARPTSGDAWSLYPSSADTSGMGGWQARAHVTAFDSTGAATVFTGSTLTVAAAPVVGLAGLAAGDWELVMLKEGAALRLCARVTNAAHPAHPSQTGAGHIAFQHGDSVAGLSPITQANKGTRMPGWANSGSAEYGCWKLDRNANNVERSWGDRTPEIGATIDVWLWYTLDTPATPFASAAWSAPSVTRKSILVADPTVVEPPPPPVTQVGDIRRLSLFSAGEAQEGASYRGNSGLQICLDAAWSHGKPDHRFTMQDMGGCHSDPGINEWKAPTGTGLGSRLGTACWLDPEDPMDVLVFVRNHVSLYPDSPNGGLFHSTDGGTTFTERVPTPEITDKRRFNKCIGHHPRSISGGRAQQRWYMPTLQSGITEVWYSGNAGMSWSKRTQFNSGVLGVVSSIQGDPADSAVLWVTSSTGLWRCTNITGTNFAAARVSGTLGLPLGAIFNAPYISGDGQTLIVNLGKSGLWKRTSVSGSYSRIGSSAFSRVSVNPYNPNEMLGWQTDPVSPFPSWSSNGGVTFQAPLSIEPRPGEPAGNGFNPTHPDTYALWRIPTPGRPEKILFWGRHTNYGNNSLNWSSADGRNWSIDMKGYGGQQLAPRTPLQIAHPTNPLIFAAAMIDMGVRVSRDGCRSFDFNNINSSALNVVHGNAVALAVHPHFGRASNPRNWLIALISDRNNRGWPVLSKDGGASWIRVQESLFPTGTKPKYTYLDGELMLYDVDDPSFAYFNRYRSTNHGETWAAMSAMPSSCIVVTGTTRRGGGTQSIFAMDRRNGSQVYRSRDRGASWQLVVDMGRFGNWPPITVQANDDNILWTRDPGNARRMRRYDLTTGTPTSRTFTTIDCTAGLSVQTFAVSKFALCAHNPQYMAVISDSQVGRGYTCGVSVNGGATWENLTGVLVPDLPMVVVMIHPLTGDLIVSGPHGPMMRRRPAGLSYPHPSLVDNLTFGGNAMPRHPLAA